MIRRHLLPLTKINENGQYVLVQPILIFFAERCIYHLLTTNSFSLIEVEFMGKIGKIGKIGKMGKIGKIGKIGKMG